MRITKKNNKVSPVSPEIEMQELPQNPGGNDGSQSSTVSRTPVPPRPKTFPSSESSSSSESALSQQSTVGNNGSPTSTDEIISLPRKLQSVTRPVGPPPISQIGGNKTRKNGQYIREIKENRNELFNKEMEIINSIRNFKHGHTDEPKKQFIRAVKRS
jgi:hypothetical protein